MSRRYLFTIEARHVGKGAYPVDLKDETQRQAGKAKGTLGRILACDIGKRVYSVGGHIQVENSAQLEARLRP